ncbi:sulfite exporter TauE/SafE family protein [bacterium]|jgi:uncharacterized protein|nr:sulfite exporter TauE/SafE family protein [bacterium]HAY67859.1 hypothetical protein [Acidimicrobiaceae bacterium]
MTTSQIVVVMVSVIIGAILKSTSGIGMPFVTIPAISYVATIEEAVVVGALPNLALNLALVWAQRSHWSRTRDLARLSAFAFVGGAAGTFLLVSLPEKPLIAVLILVVLGYVALKLASPEFEVGPETSHRWAPVVGSAAGIMQGAVGISGPIVVSWVQSLRLDRNAQILAVTVLFAAAGISQFPVLVASGELKGLWIVTLAACIPALATIPLGSRIRDRLSSAAFDQFVLALLVFSAIGLAWRTFG